MNYIELIKNFWTSHNANSFSTTEIALYFYLLEVFNVCQWKNQIKRNNRRVEADLDISYNTLKAARNKLQQSGLLYFKSKNGDANVIYTLSNFDEVTNEVDCEVTNEVSTRSVHIKDKLNYISISLRENERFVFESLNPLMEEFLNDPVIIEDFQRTIGPPYPSPDTVKELIKEFFVKLTVDGETSKDRKSAIYHFKSWYRQELESKNKHKPNEKPQKTGTAAGFKQFR